MLRSWVQEAAAFSMGKCGTQNSVAAPDIVPSTSMHLRANDTSSGLINQTITCNRQCRVSAIYHIRSVCVLAGAVD
jgi:hypothetical protein